MKHFKSQPVVCALIGILCAGGSLLVPSIANAKAKTTKSKSGSTGTTSTGTTSTGTTSTKPSGSKGGHKTGSNATGTGDIALLQVALSVTLTDAQKVTITAAATTRDAAIQAALDAYKTQVAAIFGLSASDLSAKVKSAGSGSTSLNDVLGTALGRSLTDAEITALADAATTRDAAIQAAIQAYGTTVAATVNLSLADLQAKVQAYLDTQRGSGSGGNCGPKTGTGTSGTGTTSGNTSYS